MAESKKNNFIQRLILTLLGVPFIIFCIFINWPFKSHLFAVILFGLLASFLGSYEFATLILKKEIKKGRQLNLISFFLPAINLGILLFAFLYVNYPAFRILFNTKSMKLLLFCLVIVNLILFFSRDILNRKLKKSFERTGLTLLGIIYIGLPSFLFPFLFNINQKCPADDILFFYNIGSKGTIEGALLVLFLVIQIFSSDIFSYIFGSLFGKNNKLNIKASPNKSWAGYIGGYLSNFVWTTIYVIIFDKIFNIIHYPLWFYYSITAIGGIIIPTGDLVESVFKRSAKVKDSGELIEEKKMFLSSLEKILGRGGILDSIDSLLYYLPFYFVLLQIYFSIKTHI